MSHLKHGGGLTLFLWAFIFLYPFTLFADSPTTQIKTPVDQVIKILTDPRFQGEGKKKERHRLLRQIILPRFDFEEMAKRSLGPEWRRRTLEEQKEFVRIFTDLLENAYLGRIESYTNEKFIYTGEKIDQGYAEVYSRVLTSKGEEFTINYKLHRVGSEWKIYDVVIEDISLVNNYRSQFNRVLTESSYEELVSRMEEKLRESTDK